MSVGDAGHDVAGVVLAAGAGTRLRPLTLLRPKAMCPVGGRPLVDLALDRLADAVGPGAHRLAVNAHHLAEQVAVHCHDRATVSLETPEVLGTAGALAALRGWVDGRHVLVTNADAYLPTGLTSLLAAGWDGQTCRLLCVDVDGPGDFPALPGPGVRYVGACLLPGRRVGALPLQPCGLFTTIWEPCIVAGLLELVRLPPGGVAIDCGTPVDYLRANLHASGGASVVGPGAQVLGRVDRTVVWDGAYVAAEECLVEVIRAGDEHHRITVPAGPGAR